MAQPIHCDAQDCPELAAVLISRIAGGPSETTAWCDPHYLEVCQAIAATVAAAEADSADQEAIDRLEAGGEVPTGSESSSDAATVDPGEPGRPADGPPEGGVDQVPTPAPAGRRRQSRVVREAEAGSAAEA